MSDKKQKKEQITELTKEQEAKLPIYAEEGIKIGLATGGDFDEAEVRKLIDDHRVMCGMQRSKYFHIFDSPIAACRSIEGLKPSNALYGQHDIYWLQFYMYFRNELGLTEETENLVNLYELAKRVGWMWVCDDTTVITRRPEELHLLKKESGPAVLHNRDGMAVKYRDGEGLYALNGIRVPAEFTWIVTTPAAELDPAKVLGIRNTELRTEAIKKVGMEIMLDKLDSKIIDVDRIGEDDYELYELDLNGNRRVYLKMMCPSKKENHVEAVPPDVKKVKEALKWREWGSVKIPVDYLVPLVRT